MSVIGTKIKCNGMKPKVLGIDFKCIRLSSLFSGRYNVSVVLVDLYLDLRITFVFYDQIKGLCYMNWKCDKN